MKDEDGNQVLLDGNSWPRHAPETDMGKVTVKQEILETNNEIAIESIRATNIELSNDETEENQFEDETHENTKNGNHCKSMGRPKRNRAEDEFLVSLTKKYELHTLNRTSPHRTGIWKKITDEFNDVTGYSYDQKTLTKRYMNYRQALKKEDRQLKSHVKGEVSEENKVFKHKEDKDFSDLWDYVVGSSTIENEKELKRKLWKHRGSKHMGRPKRDRTEDELLGKYIHSYIAFKNSFLFLNLYFTT